MGYPQTKIKDSVKCARSTVGEVLKRCREAGLTLENAQSMTPEGIYGLAVSGSNKKLCQAGTYYKYIYNELKKRPNLNLQFLWSEFKPENLDGLEYSQFCERFDRWQNQTGKKSVCIRNENPAKRCMLTGL